MSSIHFFIWCMNFIGKSPYHPEHGALTLLLPANKWLANVSKAKSIEKGFVSIAKEIVTLLLKCFLHHSHCSILVALAQAKDPSMPGEGLILK